MQMRNASSLSKLFVKLIAVPAITAASASIAALLMFEPVGAQEEMPIIINKETGLQVSLTPAYWNGNVDIANRRISCHHYLFDPQTLAYELKGQVREGLPDGTISYADFVHAPLTEQHTSSYVDHPQLPHHLSPVWSVTDGIYQGIAPMSMGRYVELVNYNYIDQVFNQSSTSNAIRVWHNNAGETGEIFSTCFVRDDNDPFVPTGTASTGNTNLFDADEVDFSFQFPDAIGTDVEVPVIHNRETGEQVQFSRGEWNYNEQIAGKIMSCGYYEWNDRGQLYYQLGEAELGAGAARLSIRYFLHYGGSSVPIIYNNDSEFFVGPDTTPIDGFTLRGASSFIELTDNGYRIWGSPDFYQFCSIRDFTPKRLLALNSTNDACDYSNADAFGGWGWNAATMLSCAPANTEQASINSPQLSDCDYSNADAFGGWGWNAITRESCAPVTNSIDPPPAAQCIDADGDGYGWNGTDTCTPGSSVSVNTTAPDNSCDYSDADLFDGWGWNATTSESCAPLESPTTPVTTAQCIDSDGDGFGWDGVATCTP